MKKKLLLCGTIVFSAFLLTGCFKRDSLEDVSITTTAYPIQYITEYLYGEHSQIESIYPDGVDIKSYKLTKKQIQDFSRSGIYIFNGLSNEKDYVVPIFQYNKHIKIIDTSLSMEYQNEMEELWLDPSNFLMLSQNIKNGLQEYISDHYLKNEITEKYNQLKIDVSNIDANLKLAVESSSNKTIVVSSDLFKFLEKYNFNVISLEENNNLTDKTVSDVKKMIRNGEISYIFLKEGETPNNTIQKIIDQTEVETLEIKTLSNITEKERQNHADYISIMNENIERFKQELYDE